MAQTTIRYLRYALSVLAGVGFGIGVQ